VVTEVVRLDTYLGLPPLEPMIGYFRMVVAMPETGRSASSWKKFLARRNRYQEPWEYLRRVKLFPGTTIAPDGSLILLIDLNRMCDRTERAAADSGQRQCRTNLCAGLDGNCARKHSFRGHRPRRARASNRGGGRLHQRAQFVAACSRERVPRETGSGWTRSGRVGDAARRHLVITDLEMPRMTGYELMVQLRQSPSTRRIP